MTDLDISAPAPEAGRHGFVSWEGHIDESKSAWAHKTGFSLGIFQWIPRANGKGLKPGPVKVRVKGFFSEAGDVYAKARDFCKMLDAGHSPNQKTYTV